MFFCVFYGHHPLNVFSQEKMPSMTQSQAIKIQVCDQLQNTMNKLSTLQGTDSFSIGCVRGYMSLMEACLLLFG